MAKKKTSGTITSFDRATCRKVGERVEEVLEELGKELGLNFSYKGGSYADNNLTMKIEAATLSEDGSVNTKEADAFKEMAKLYGLKTEDLGREITLSGEKFTIEGLRTRARKKPILLTRVKDGKAGYICPVNSVLRALGRKVKEEDYETF